MKFLKIILFYFIIFSFAFGIKPESSNSQKAKGEKVNKKLKQFKNKYCAKNVYTSRNGKEVKMSYYDFLVEIDKNELGEKSLRLYNDMIEIFGDPLNESKRLQYLNHFPKRFSEFAEIFNSADFGELYHVNDMFLYILEEIIKEYPEKGAILLVSLAKKAKYNADAPGHLLRILSIYINDFYDFFIIEFNKLNDKDELNAIDFLADYENFYDNKIFENILNKLKEKNNSKLLKKFVVAKEKRIAMGLHKENR